MAGWIGVIALAKAGDGLVRPSPMLDFLANVDPDPVLNLYPDPVLNLWPDPVLSVYPDPVLNLSLDPVRNCI